MLDMCLVVFEFVFLYLHLSNLDLHLSALICNLLNMCLVVWGPGWGTLPVMDLLAAREGGGDSFLYLPVFVFKFVFVFVFKFIFVFVS